MSINSMSSAPIPYTPPKTPMEFVKSEVERGLKNGTITQEQLTPRQRILPFNPSQVLGFGLYGQKTAKKMADALKSHSLQIIYSDKTKKFTVLESSTIAKEAIEKIFSEKSYQGWKPKVLDEVDPFGNRLVQLSCVAESSMDMSEYLALPFSNFDRQSSPSRVSRVAFAKLNGEEIAEVLQGEAGFTIATDKKPILATYGCGPCVALGGYDPTNKIAFVVHFQLPSELRESGDLIFHNIAKLVKEKITTPIQLHLIGGIKGKSEPIIEAIKIWMTKRKDLPMEIASADILDSDMRFPKRLSIDSRTGVISDYDPKTNSKSRGISDLDVMSALMSASDPRIKLAYTPK